MASSIVVIGPASSLPSLRERLSSGAELQTFTDAEAIQALEHIVRTKPTIVALEHEFSATARGSALIDRIKDDPELNTCEIRVVASDGALDKVAARRSSGRHAVASPVAAPLLDPVGTRRAPRVALRAGVEILVDGNTATVVDLSTVGAQVVSQKMLKPNQRVRVALFDAHGTIRCNGSIVWAAFEMPKGHAARYRAGIEFSSVDINALEAYIGRHKKT
ncbi:MAG: PilZ domain-containing protein [Acidobacteriota bacterium]